MLDWTDRHCRVFHRQLTRQAWLYSEMVTTGAIIYGDNLERFLGHSEDDVPVVLQLGGSGPEDLAKCAALGEEWGYSEINLNVGCPSDRVQNNMIGACLMGHPSLVAEGVAAMKAAVSKIPVTVKSRIGIDDQEDFETLVDFVTQVHDAGADGMIIHARKAWLQGLSPKENREVPPLKYDWVRRIKQLFPEFPIAINGGIASPQDGLAFYNPMEIYQRWTASCSGVRCMKTVFIDGSDRLYYDDVSEPLNREAVLEAMYPYIERHLSSGGKLNQVSRHMLGLFAGLPGGRMWRRYISENAFQPGAGIEVLQEAYRRVAQEIQRMEEQNR